VVKVAQHVWIGSTNFYQISTFLAKGKLFFFNLTVSNGWLIWFSWLTSPLIFRLQTALYRARQTLSWFMYQTVANVSLSLVLLFKQNKITRVTIIISSQCLSTLPVKMPEFNKRMRKKCHYRHFKWGWQFVRTGP